MSDSATVTGGARRKTPAGMISRKSYTRKSGKKVKSVKVKSGPIKDRGLKGKGPKILPKPQKNALEGYSTKQPSKSRRDKLKRLVKKKGYSTIVRDLNLRANFNKRTAPDANKILREDMKFLKENRS